MDRGMTESHELNLLMVKEEEEEKDVKVEEYDHVIACKEEEEKPFAEFHCKPETDVTESRVPVEKEEAEPDDLLESKFFLYFLK